MNEDAENAKRCFCGREEVHVCGPECEEPTPIEETEDLGGNEC